MRDSARAEDEPSVLTTTFLSLPASLHSALLSDAGVDAWALALTCKALSSLWDADTTCQALWLLQNSSSIRINQRTRPRLQALAQILTNRPGVDPMELMWVRWLLRAKPGSGYGECEGLHGDSRSCQFDPNRRSQLKPTFLQLSMSTPSEAAAAATGNVSCAGSRGLHTASPCLNQDQADDDMQDQDRILCLSRPVNAGRLPKDGDSQHDMAVAHVVAVKTGGLGGAFMQACYSGDLSAVKQSVQSRFGRITVEEQQAAENLAAQTGNTLLLHFLASSYHAAGKRASVSGVNSIAARPSYSGREDWIEATIKDLIFHLRDPLSLIKVCLQGESERSHQSALRCLLSAGKWEMAHSFLLSAPVASDFSLSGWEQLGLAYLSNTSKGDRWPADGGSGPLWGAIIDCASRSNMTRQLYAVTDWDGQLWPRIFTYSFAEGGSDLALDTAETAAFNFSGHKELRQVAEEHRIAGREAKALRCENLAWHLTNPQGSCAYLHMILDDDDYEMMEDS